MSATDDRDNKRAETAKLKAETKKIEAETRKIAAEAFAIEKDNKRGSGGIGFGPDLHHPTGP